MAIVKPFRGLRPTKELAARVAAPPYDVLDSKEAREMAKGNPYTFLHVNKPEIDVDPSINLYDDAVYQKGAENLRKFIANSVVFQDAEPVFYIYRQIMGDHAQTGLVAGASVAEYENDIIKKHELTRPDKEDDRVKHIDTQNAQVGPVFLTYKAQDAIDNIVAEVSRTAPEYDLTSDDGVQHTVWLVNKKEDIEKIINEFAKVDILYVADGHHRSASALRVRNMRMKENPNHTGEENYNYFLTVIFPDNQMQILDYNRIVKDLNGNSVDEFVSKVSEKFDLQKLENGEVYKPAATHEFSMYLDGSWYKMVAKSDSFPAGDPVKSLDVSILQENLLAPLLGIGNPRKDQRINFVGGIRGLKELEKRVNEDNYEVAFACYPTSIEELMTIADAGEIMPPKSTWFEPKLRSGLVVHLLDD